MTKGTFTTWMVLLAPLTLFALLLVALLLQGCEINVPSETERLKNETMMVIVIGDEDPVESIERWLLNIVQRGNMSYNHQLKAAELYLLMHGYGRCDRGITNELKQDN